MEPNACNTCCVANNTMSSHLAIHRNPRGSIIYFGSTAISYPMAVDGIDGLRKRKEGEVFASKHQIQPGCGE